uniref:Uncharacterized protein n=1 Tax=Anopheles atroparvus TaxID=41427 RepID=A0AAG5DQN6_ANOAO
MCRHNRKLVATTGKKKRISKKNKCDIFWSTYSGFPLKIDNRAFCRKALVCLLPSWLWFVEI